MPLEQFKAQTQAQLGQFKAQSDAQLAGVDAQLQERLAAMQSGHDMQVEQLKAQHASALQYSDQQFKQQMRAMEIEAEFKLAEMKMHTTSAPPTWRPITATFKARGLRWQKAGTMDEARDQEADAQGRQEGLLNDRSPVPQAAAADRPRDGRAAHGGDQFGPGDQRPPRAGASWSWPTRCWHSCLAPKAMTHDAPLRRRYRALVRGAVQKHQWRHVALVGAWNDGAVQTFLANCLRVKVTVVASWRDPAVMTPSERLRRDAARAACGATPRLTRTGSP